MAEVPHCSLAQKWKHRSTVKKLIANGRNRNGEKVPVDTYLL